MCLLKANELFVKLLVWALYLVLRVLSVRPKWFACCLLSSHVSAADDSY